MSEEMTLLILPTKQVQELNLLKKTDWIYIESITDVANADDIDESLSQIREFYGKKF